MKNPYLTCSSARQFVCRRCTDVRDGTEEPVEILRDEVESVKGFCCLEDRLNASGGCETAVTSRVKIGWMKYCRVRRVATWEKIFSENERDGLSQLRKISNVV